MVAPSRAAGPPTRQPLTRRVRSPEAETGPPRNHGAYTANALEQVEGPTRRVGPIAVSLAAAIEPLADKEGEGHNILMNAIRELGTGTGPITLPTPPQRRAGPAQAVVTAAAARQLAPISGVGAVRCVAVGLLRVQIVGLNARLLPSHEGMEPPTVSMLQEGLPQLAAWQVGQPSPQPPPDEEASSTAAETSLRRAGP